MVAPGPVLIHTASGLTLDLLDPDPACIQLEDIASGLAHVCRFAGQCSRFYPVAQHSVLCSQVVAPEHARWALLHDATEAYLGDIPRPVKSLCPEYRQLEARLHLAVARRFGLAQRMPDEVHAADTAMLVAEWAVLMRGACPVPGVAARIAIDPLDPEAARGLFIARARQLGM